MLPVARCDVTKILGGIPFPLKPNNLALRTQLPPVAPSKPNDCALAQRNPERVFPVGVADVSARLPPPNRVLPRIFRLLATQCSMPAPDGGIARLQRAQSPAVAPRNPGSNFLADILDAPVHLRARNPATTFVAAMPDASVHPNSGGL